MTFHLLGGMKHSSNKDVSGQLMRFLKQFAWKSVVSQFALLSVLFGVLPINAEADQSPLVQLVPYTIENSQIHFDKTKVFPLVITETKPIKMTIGESKAQEEARVAVASAARKARTEVRALQATTKPSVNPDLATKRALVQKAAAAYSIPWQILESVWQIETGKSWDTQVRSYAGAQGPAQFMPATWRRYGVDGNGDGQADIHSAEDAVHGAAHYLAANGADRGDIRHALLAYNHADWYVKKVLAVAYELGYQG